MSLHTPAASGLAGEKVSGCKTWATLSSSISWRIHNVDSYAPYIVQPSHQWRCTWLCLWTVNMDFSRNYRIGTYLYMHK